MKKLPSDFVEKCKRLRSGAESLCIITENPTLLELYDAVTNPYKPIEGRFYYYYMGVFEIACTFDLIKENFEDYLELALHTEHLRIQEEYLYADKDNYTAETC